MLFLCRQAGATTQQSETVEFMLNILSNGVCNKAHYQYVLAATGSWEQHYKKLSYCYVIAVISKR
jgi:hypothetical protein